WPAWLEPPLFLLFRVAFAPLAFLVSMIVAFTTFGQTQQRLLPFLASRSIFGGSGWLDSEGRFHLAEKAETRRAVWLEAIADLSRPVFNNAHFIKFFYAFLPRWKELLAPRQRLQISLGDSNMCEEAEYLRVATTLLVLDAI